MESGPESPPGSPSKPKEDKKKSKELVRNRIDSE